MTRMSGKNYVEDHFPAGLFFWGIIVFTVLGFLVSSKFFTDNVTLVKIVLHVCFLGIAYFILFYEDITKSQGGKKHREKRLTPLLLTTCLIVSYIILVSQVLFSEFLPYLFIAGIILSIYMGFVFSEQKTRSFFKNIIVIYSSAISYFFISTKVFDFGNLAIDNIENTLPVVDNLRLLVFSISVLLVLIYGLRKASAEPRPYFWQIPFQQFREGQKSIVFIDGLIKGIQKFTIRIWNILAVMLNRVIFVVGSAAFYLFMALKKIYEETISIIAESKDIVTSILIIFLSFTIAKYAIILGNNEYQFLISTCNDCEGNLGILFSNFLMLAACITGILLLPIIYDSLVQFLFTRSINNQRIAKNNKVINNTFTDIIESVLMIGLFFTISGWILVLISIFLNIIDLDIILPFRHIGKYCIISSIVIIALILIYLGLQLTQKVKVKKN